MNYSGVKIRRLLVMVVAVLFAVAATAQQLNPKLPLPGEAPTGSPVEKHGHLAIDGNKIVSEHGHDVQLRGMSFFLGNAVDGRPFYNDDVVGWMVHDWKVDVLRVPVAVANEQRGGGSEGYLDGDETRQWAQLKTVVEGAIRRGIYVIVDWHTHIATSTNFNGRNIRDGAVQFFTRVAQEWGQYPNIIYEIYNEPCNSGTYCLDENWNAIVSYSNTVISAIRVQGSNNVVIVGTLGFSSLQNPEEINSHPVSGNNVAYSLHFYNNDFHWNNYRNRVLALLNHSAPKAVFVSEFGTSNADGTGALNIDRTNTWLAFLDNDEISWVNWSITNKNERSAILKSTVSNSTGGWIASGDHLDPSGDLSVSGEYIRNKLRDSGSGITNTTYTINITAGEGGSVIKSPDKPEYDYNESVTLTAVPDLGYEFSNWSGDLTGEGTGIYEVTVKGINLDIGAVFIVSENSDGPDYEWYAGKSSPYTITKASELAGLAEIVNGTADEIARDNFNGKIINLSNNIDLSDYENWTPIGTNFPFNGTFDGQNKTISNLTINRSGSDMYQGLFGRISSSAGPVQNLGLENVDIAGGSYVGGVAGVGRNINNCWVTGTVRGTNYVGGVAGSLSSENFNVSNNYSAVTVSGNNHVGGIVGGIAQNGGYYSSDNVLNNNYSTGTVSGTDYVGGLVGSWSLGVGDMGGLGSSSKGLLSNSYSTGSVSGADYVGGLAGRIFGQHGYDGNSVSVEIEVAVCAALNKEVIGTGTNVGRVVGAIQQSSSSFSCEYGNSWECTNGTFTLSNNIAFDGMTVKIGAADKTLDKGANKSDGADIAVEEIKADPTIGGRFALPDWTTAVGKLPGLFGNAVDMPEHLSDEDESGYAWYVGKSSPYIITTADELAEFAQIVNGTASGIARDDFDGKTVRLGNDIMLNDTTDWKSWDLYNASAKSWIPIGSVISDTCTITCTIYDVARAFKGTFDGMDYTISGIYINGFNNQAYSYGLFGFVSGGTVKNVGILASWVSGSQFVGGVVGYIFDGGTVANSYFVGTVGIISYSNQGYAGGVAGAAEGIVTNSYSIGTVTVLDSPCYYCRIGGVVGSLETGTVANSYFAGMVSYLGNFSSFNSFLGGVVGFVNTGNVVNSYSTGTITTDSGYYIGGVAGVCADCTIANSYSTVTINAYGVISNFNIGGVVASIGMNSSIVNSYWNVEANHNPSNVSGTGMTTANMKSSDFVESLNNGISLLPNDLGVTYLYWEIIPTENEGYPIHGDHEPQKNNAATPTITIQPSSSTVTIGAVHAISVSASTSDEGALTYQWYSNTTAGSAGGTIIDGATSASYSVPTSTAGTYYYYVIVTNTNGSVNGVTTAHNTSGAVTITVNEPVITVNAETPAITEQPSSGAVTADSDYSISVLASVSDDGTLTYQWYSNTTASNSGGTIIDGATSASYSVPTSTIGTYYYYVVVTNTNNSVNGAAAAVITSGVVTVTVNDPVVIVNAQTPSVSTQTSGDAVIAGANYTISASASVTDGGTLTYQWYSSATDSNAGGTLIDGATAPFYSFPASAVGTFYYYVVITNTIIDNEDGGVKTVSTVSQAVPVVVESAPVIPVGFSGLKFITPASPDDSLIAGQSSFYSVQVMVLNSSGNAFTDRAVTVRLSADLSGAIVTKNITTDASTGIAEFGLIQASAVVGDTIRFTASAGGIITTASLRIISPPTHVTVSNVQASGFTAGPNPVAKSVGEVNFFHAGTPLTGAHGTLTIFDAQGNVVNRINIDESRLSKTSVFGMSRRNIGSWDLRDAKGRPVAAGTYLVRGTLTTPNGKKERISIILGVR